MFLSKDGLSPIDLKGFETQMARGFGLGDNFKITMKMVKAAREQRALLAEGHVPNYWQHFIKLTKPRRCILHLEAGKPKLKKRERKEAINNSPYTCPECG